MLLKIWWYCWDLRWISQILAYHSSGRVWEDFEGGDASLTTYVGFNFLLGTLLWIYFEYSESTKYLLSSPFQSTMHHQEKYTLHWHSYSDHLREALNEMLLSSEFANVTLVTDDKKQIRAHRNILFSVLAVQFSRVFSKLTVRMSIPLFTSEEFSILKWSQ